MPKVTLSESWIYAGTTYGPGEADLPPDAHEAIGKKGGFPPTEVEPAATGSTGETGSAEQGGGQGTPPEDKRPDPLGDAVGEEAAANLTAAGYGDIAAIDKATDAELLAVKGIAAGRLKALRALTVGE